MELLPVDQAARRPQTLVAPLGVRAVVVDSGALMNDILRRARHGRSTGLFEAASGPSTRVFAAEHVRTEIQRHLPRLASERGLEASAVLGAWHSEYVPNISFVRLPSHYAPAEVRLLATRDETDVPTAALACLIQADAVVAEDRDLIDTGFAVAPWLDATLALRNLARLQTGLAATNVSLSLLMWSIWALWERAARRPRSTAAVAVAAIIALASPALRRRMPSRGDIASLFEPVGQAFGGAVDRGNQAAAELQRRIVPRVNPTPLERVAFVVARGTRPLTAKEIAFHAAVPYESVRRLLAQPPFSLTDSGYQLGICDGNAYVRGPSSFAFE